jgi:thioredoxin-like negative regulator of GroEL
MWFIGAAVVIAAIVAVVALTSQPGYSGFDVLGKQPAIVQVFLPGWPNCAQLKRVVDALRQEFHGRVAFVLADLNTPEGLAFANRHGVGNTTLVFLAADGKRLETLVGIQEEGALRERIRTSFGLWSAWSMHHGQRVNALDSRSDRWARGNSGDVACSLNSPLGSAMMALFRLG